MLIVCYKAGFKKSVTTVSIESTYYLIIVIRYCSYLISHTILYFLWKYCVHSYFSEHQPSVTVYWIYDNQFCYTFLCFYVPIVQHDLTMTPK